MREAQEVAAQKLSAEIEQAVAEIRTLKVSIQLILCVTSLTFVLTIVV